MTKQYTQKQYDNAKERAYNRGWKDGVESESLSNEYLEEVMENAGQVNSWKKWEQFDFDLTVAALCVLVVTLLVGMIMYNPNF